MRNGLLMESVIVGFSTLIVGSALMLMPIKGIWFAYVGTFLVGFITHLLWEALGANKWFCETKFAS
jgi:hypothetical protein